MRTVEVVQRPVGHVEVTAREAGSVEVNEAFVLVTPGPGPTPEQIQAAVDAYMATHPVPGPTPEQVAIAVAEYLTANPVQPVPPTEGQVLIAVTAYLTANPVQPIAPTQAQVSAGVTAYLIANPVDPVPPTAAQVQAAVDVYLSLNPVQPIAPTQQQVQAAVDVFLTANPVDPIPPTGMQVAAAVAVLLTQDPGLFNEPIEAYFRDDAALRESDKGANNGVATLDASGGLVQRMKIATGSTPIAIRDTEGVGNGKSSSFVASIALEASSVILMKTGVWQSNLDYVARIFGSCADGIIDITVALLTNSGTQVVQAINRGNVDVGVTFGRFADGYSGWAFERAFGRCQVVVTECAVVGNGTGDNQVRGWAMEGANDKTALTQQVPVVVG